MEDVPSEVIGVSDTDAASLTLPDDALAFAVGDDGFAYIINLPVDGDHFLGPEDTAGGDGLLGEVGELQGVGDSKCAAVSTAALFTSTTFPTASTAELVLGGGSSGANNFSLGDDDPSVGLASGEEDTLPPVEIQYLDGELFLGEGQKCQVEGITLDLPEIKFETELHVPHHVQVETRTALPVMEVVGKEEEEEVQVKEEPAPEELVSSLPTSGTGDEAPVENAQEEVKAEVPDLAIAPPPPPPEVCSPPVSQVVSPPPPQATINPATKTVRTYGKPKTKSATNQSPSCSVPAPPAIAPGALLSGGNEGQKPVKFLRMAPVHVKQSPSLSIHIPPRQRRLIIDPQKQIPIPEFKRQLVNTRDIVHARSELAPSTRKAMLSMELGGVAHFFAMPGRPLRTVRLSRLFTKHLVAEPSSRSSRRAAESSKRVAPLTADLRIPCPSTDDEVDDDEPRTKPKSQPIKRLIPHIFRGLWRPPLLEEHKRRPKKATLNGRIKQNLPHREIVSSQTSSQVKPASPVHEVVYTVGDGDSLVLKSDTEHPAGLSLEEDPQEEDPEEEEEEEEEGEEMEMVDDDGDTIMVSGVISQADPDPPPPLPSADVEAFLLDTGDNTSGDLTCSEFGNPFLMELPCDSKSPPSDDLNLLSASFQVSPT